MAFSGIIDVLYVIDILSYTVINDGWGIGIGKLKNFFLDGFCAMVTCMKHWGLRTSSLSTGTNADTGKNVYITT
jgi:hypothetical protein